MELINDSDNGIDKSLVDDKDKSLAGKQDD